MQTKILMLVLAVYSQSAAVAVVPPECKDLTYCTVPLPNYPQEKFNNMFKDKKLLVAPSPVSHNVIRFDNRNSIGGEDDGCVSKSTVDHIYYVREGLDKPWRTVVQAPQVDYVQVVTLETCATVNAPCHTELTHSLTNFFVSYCQQKNIYYKFLVEKSANSHETETVMAELPVCCSCHYRKA